MKKHRPPTTNHRPPIISAPTPTAKPKPPRKVDPNKPQATRFDVAAHFGVTVRTVDRWLADAENPLPHYSRGGAIRFILSEVEAHLKQQKAASS